MTEYEIEYRIRIVSGNVPTLSRMVEGVPLVFDSSNDAITYRVNKDKQLGAIKRRLAEGNEARRFVIQTSAGEIAVYRYGAVEGRSCDQALPLVFNFHGGGYVLQDWELDIPFCRDLSRSTGSTVLNVDYLVGPEHKFPVPQHSALEVIKYCDAHRSEMGLTGGPIIVCGHSAGGNLAAALCVLASRSDEVSIGGLIMNYPPLAPLSVQRPSVNTGSALSQTRMQQYASWAYATEADMLDPVASPLLATDVVWPPALVHAASLDTLCEDSRRFAAMLDEAGVAVDYKCYEGCHHGFTHEAFAREYDPCASKDVLMRTAAFVRRVATAAVVDEGGVA